jgi:hypothetical protein
MLYLPDVFHCCSVSTNQHDLSSNNRFFPWKQNEDQSYMGKNSATSLNSTQVKTTFVRHGLYFRPISCNATPIQYHPYPRTIPMPGPYETPLKDHLTTGIPVPGHWAHQCSDEQCRLHTWHHPSPQAFLKSKGIRSVMYLVHMYIYVYVRFYFIINIRSKLPIASAIHVK